MQIDMKDRLADLIAAANTAMWGRIIHSRRGQALFIAEYLINKGVSLLPPDQPERITAPPPTPVLAHPRHCKVKELSAVFHRWVECDEVMLSFEVMLKAAEQRTIHRKFRESGVVPPGCRVDLIRTTCALVEYQDGTVSRVDPEDITFTDVMTGKEEGQE